MMSQFLPHILHITATISYNIEKNIEGSRIDNIITISLQYVGLIYIYTTWPLEQDRSSYTQTIV